MISDQQQRDQALNITQSYIVQAPAGSGKTELLTQRYLKLLSNCSEPENVIVMTFTNKAVDELKKRVIQSLRMAQGKAPDKPHKKLTFTYAKAVLEHAKKRGWDLLNTPERLKISTIDSLSSMIVNRYPNRQQLIPLRIMAQDWERERAYQVAAQQTLLLIHDSEHQDLVSRLLAYFDNNTSRFYQLVAHMLSKRDQWLNRLYIDKTLDPKILQQSAKQIVQSHLQKLLKAAKPYLDDGFFLALSANTKEEFSNLQSLPDASAKALYQWQALGKVLLTEAGAGSWRKTVNKRDGFPPEVKKQKEIFIGYLDSLSKDKRLEELFIDASKLPDIEVSAKQMQVLNDIAQVLRLAVAELQILFQEKQAQDFIQVALDADQALDTRASISDIVLFLDHKVEHILIDEFQDTSSSQFNLIHKLVSHWQDGDGKTLFFVGDPMQSIYRFRESQVGLFIQVRDFGIANVHPKAIRLSENFRSSQSIVEKNNVFFSEIFPSLEDIYCGAISYSHSTAHSQNTDNQAVSFYPFLGKDYQSEAEQVLSIVKQSLLQNPREELAILVRNRNHLSLILPLLKTSNIAFESVNTTPLRNHLFTRDLLSLTKALIHSGDKLAWLSVLRAPWCGLLLSDLYTLSQDDSQNIFEKINNPKRLQTLTKDAQQRIQRLGNIMSQAMENRARFDFAQILSHTIEQLLDTKTLSMQERNIKDQFLHIVSRCESERELKIDTIELMLKDLYAPSEQANVKIMTIHQAKGLEFDTVIIPGLGRQPRNDDSPIIQIKEFANDSLLLSPIKGANSQNQSQTYQYLQSINSSQNYYESMRLLYVAMTRAKNKLHLLGSLGQGKAPSTKSFLNFLMPFYQGDFETLDTKESIQNVTEKTFLKRHKKVITKPIKANKFKTQNLNLETGSEGQYSRLLGTLVHRYYEKELLNPSAESVKTRLLEFGVATSDVGELQKRVIQLLNNTKRDQNFDWLFKQRNSTQTEAEFITDNGSIVIDRLFIDKDTLWVIDFKTAAPAKDEILTEFISRQKIEHYEQLSGYYLALSKAYNHKIQCALYYPAISQLIELSIKK